MNISVRVRETLVFVSLEKVRIGLVRLLANINRLVSKGVPAILHPVLAEAVMAAYRVSGGLIKEMVDWSRDPIFSGAERR